MTGDFNTYDQAMALIREQTTALKVCRAALRGCQAENEKLLGVVKFYAETSWKDLSLIDRGEKARKAKWEAMGNGRPSEV